jgi:hypothetical protein
MALLSSLKKFCDLIDPIFKLLLIPCACVFLYAGTSWLDKNYVPRNDYAVQQAENKGSLDSISMKLDTLIISSATSSQKFADLERRISRLEDKADGGKSK